MEGQSLRRQPAINVRMMWRALISPLFACALGVVATTAAAQDAPPASSVDAERIQKMRDLAAEQDAKQATQHPAGDGAVADAKVQSAEVGSVNAEKQAQEAFPANEALPLGVSSNVFGSEAGSSTATGAGGDGWLLSTLAALGVVIALVFVIRWVLRRGGVVAKASSKGSVVEVLSRSTIAPRSHVLLLRVGPRVLVVSDSQAGMRTLSEVSDPVEVAELLGAVDASDTSSMTKNFNGVMKKLSGQWSESDDVAAESTPGDVLTDGVRLNQTRGTVSSVRGRLAALSRAGGGA